MTARATVHWNGYMVFLSHDGKLTVINKTEDEEARLSCPEMQELAEEVSSLLTELMI